MAQSEPNNARKAREGGLNQADVQTLKRIGEPRDIEYMGRKSMRGRTSEVLLSVDSRVRERAGIPLENPGDAECYFLPEQGLIAFKLLPNENEPEAVATDGGTESREG